MTQYAWRRTLRRGSPVTAVLLATSLLEDIPSGPAGQAAYYAMRAILGIGGGR